MRIVLWDIDGTLVTTAGAGRRAIDRALQELFGTTEATKGIKFDGRTDPWIVDGVLEARGVAAPERPEWRKRILDTYVSFLEDELSRPPPEGKPFGPLPGVVALVERLSRRHDCVLGLLTGNIERGARAKLAVFDLWRHFELGAWGDDADTRPGLLPVAVGRATARRGRSFRCEDAVVIGDTPHDVEVGRVHGARTIAVATGGGYGKDELAASRPDRLLSTIDEAQDLEAWIFESHRVST